MGRRVVQGRKAALLFALGLVLGACGGEDDRREPFATAPGTTASATGTSETGEPDDDDDADENTGDEDGESSDEESSSGPSGETGDPPAQIDAFRFTSLVMRDPHFYTELALQGCVDITDETSLGADASVNGIFQSAITQDDPMMPDGFLDLSLVLLFDPLDQTDGFSGTMELANGMCIPPVAATLCSPNPMVPTFAADYVNMVAGSTCLGPNPGELGGYTPPPTTTSGPCMLAGPTQIQISTGVFSLELDMVEVAAQYDGAPADGLVNGSVRGFLSRQVAETTMLPQDVADLLGVSNVAGLLPGGAGNCHTANDTDGDGWWMHADFEAARVPWNP